MSTNKQAMREEFQYMQNHYSDPADRERQLIYIAAEALLDELEAAEWRNAELKYDIKSANDRYENRTPTQWAYDQACSTIEKHRLRAEAAEKRIAELEAREVNLPKYCVAKVMLLSGFDRQYAEGWCAGNDNAIHEIRAAGITVKGE